MSKQFTFEAIGTHFWIEIFDEISDEELKATQGRLELLSSVFNQEYSRFRPDSFISELNRERILQNSTKECRDLLSLGKELYTQTEGVFNILTGHILEARGYDAEYSFKAREGVETLTMCNPLTDLNISKSEITLSCGNVDIGGYGKGYLIDKLARNLRGHGIKYFLVNGGGDMYGTSNHDEPIEIYLEHPTEDKKYLTKTTLLNQGFAASSPFKRQWKHDEKTYTHIVSNNETPNLAVFVKAENGVLADAFSKACLLLSENNLLQIAEPGTITFARFNPATNQFWQTKGFDAI
ncbi:MAG: FAD:protein FMN transferase [Candidatus Pacebacteria bacterium]|nr:FAD:protein FMN transferase [Candidatus Paceibacterota bacterium]MBP9842615.1 FAD:protein FMN transferase [Candidatus Paceibacterota bacterium]